MGYIYQVMATRGSPESNCSNYERSAVPLGTGVIKRKPEVLEREREMSCKHGRRLACFDKVLRCLR